ncbi:MAG: alpha/beta fold hydrolase [Pseudomonadaceae bacterium]|nr:alpha/beta fold hydrolase [Pseudomonadaceae bacterium]
MNEVDENDIAIVGMAIRVPGCDTPEDYWRTVRDGIEQIKTYSDEELLAKGVSKRSLNDPNYVKKGVPLQNVGHFDPEFFGFSPKEAAILDPQHRQFYEVAWEALERASHTPGNFDGPIGVFAGCGMGAYLHYNLLTNPDLVEDVGLFLLRHTGNDKDFLATRASYAFDLRGPSINVQTACSTSLVATHLAVQSLLSFECDMALAGGVTIEMPHQIGYTYKEGEVLSPDGHCRAFDHKSKGTVFGSGAGVVALRRLKDALDDGDHVHAVIKASAVNNDGSSKVGYLAPSVEGQASAVAEALALGDIAADTIGYIECHGTGTPVGDPIEIAALTRAFRQSTDKKGYCRVGSVKTNIGHLDTAAGVASLIKATLALENQTIPPSLNFEAPNPEIDFDNSPFKVAAELQPWQDQNHPRRAAVNSLGVGGTNAFVILEEAPAVENADSSQHDQGGAQFLLLSARTKKSLDDYAQKLAQWINEHPDQSLNDVSFTLMNGRERFEYQRVLACESLSEAAELLREGNPRRVFNHTLETTPLSPVFLFPGGGAQYFQMGKDLYNSEAIFREQVDRGLNLLKTRHDIDLDDVFHASDESRNPVTETLDQPSVQLPLTFIVEHALAKLWESYGVVPEAMIGHSMGENTAACIAGVLSFEDTLGLILLRGQLFEQTQAGGVLSVPLPADELRTHLPEGLDLATANSPNLSVASGPSDMLDKLAASLKEIGIESQRVRVNVAAHSKLLDPILPAFRTHLQSLQLNPPQIPIVSNRTGQWLTDAEACDPEYWVAHLRNTVLFSNGVEKLLENQQRICIEVGPGNMLGSFVRQHEGAPVQRVLASMRHPEEQTRDDVYFKSAVGRYIAVGGALSENLDAERLWPKPQRRLPLPTYAFQHASYWIEPGKSSLQVDIEDTLPERLESLDDWYFEPKWIQQGIIDTDATPRTWLFFRNGDDLSDRLINDLTSQGHTVVEVSVGDVFRKVDTNRYTLAPEAGLEGYDALIAALLDSDTFPDQIVHAWLTTWDTSHRPGSTFLHRIQNQGFYALFYLAKALGKKSLDNPIALTILANNAQSLHKHEIVMPEKATALGPSLVIPREMPNVSTKFVDTYTVSSKGKSTSKRMGPEQLEASASRLMQELHAPHENEVVAWREEVRHMRRLVKRAPTKNTQGLPLIRKNGVFLITGGFGGIATAISDWLVQAYDAKIVLLSRTPLPRKEDWDRWLAEHPPTDSISKSILRMRELDSAGVEVLQVSADVTVAEQMQAAQEQIIEKFGALNGIFHTAGTVSDSLIAMKTQREVEDVFAAKVYGTLVIADVFGSLPLDFVALFSSSSAFIAPQGQIDYVAANSFVNTFADAQSGLRDYPTIALNWGIWRDVGLVAPSSDNIAVLTKLHETQYPLFAAHRSGRDGLRETHRFEGELSTSDWVIAEHRLKNNDALLPGTGYIELIRAALQQINGNVPWILSNLVFEQPLFVEDTGPRAFRVNLLGNSQSWQVSVEAADLTDPSSWSTCVRASVKTDVDKPSSPVLGEIQNRFELPTESAAGSGAIKTRQEAHLKFGRRWHVLKQIYMGDGEALGELKLPADFATDLDTYLIHPGLLDIATGFAMDLIPGYAEQDIAEALWVPLSYGAYTHIKPLEGEIFSWVRLAEGSQPDHGIVAFDIDLFDNQGTQLAQVSRLTLQRTEGQFSIEKDKASHATPQSTKGKSPGELALAHNLSQGIDVPTGITALQQVLTHPAPSQVVISSMDMRSLMKQADHLVELSLTADQSSKFERPALDSDFEEPRDKTEIKLAELWGKLLGVEGVGIHDSFFDLGGHSLVAVRLFNEIRELFGTDLPMSVLMQSPTIADLASIIRGGPVGEGGESDADSEESEKPTNALQFQHVVPMQSGPVGGATPLFVVAGMFGNVLNLSHLANLLGEERPFYALQARGLYGDSVPHESFEEMATDYIKEIRQVQPEGPYLLGGYSGGGLVAYEIARQLMAVGEEVLHVIMLDTPAPSFPHFSIADKANMILQGIKKDGLGYLKTKVQTRLKWEREQRELANASDDDPMSFQSQNIGAAFLRALRNYDTPKVDVAVTVLRPKLNIHYQLSGGRMVDDDRNYVFPDNGWGPFVERLQIVEIPGNHDSMVLEPNVRVLVSEIRRVLAQSNKVSEDTLNAA